MQQVREVHKMQEVIQDVGPTITRWFASPKPGERNDEMNGTECAPLVRCKLSSTGTANFARDGRDSRW